jgi:PAS domain S-box-containing protein
MNITLRNGTILSVAFRYGTAVFAVATAIVLRLLLDPILHERLPFITLFAAVVFVVWHGGKGPATFTLGLGLLAVTYLIIDPRYSFKVADRADVIGLIFYAVISSGCILLVEQLRTTAQRATESAAETLFQYQEVQRESKLRQAAEAVVIDERERLRVTLASIGDAVITTDAEGRVTFLNNVAQQLTGWTSDEARGLPLTQIFKIIHETTREPVDDPAMRSLREGKIVALDNHTVLISKDGMERPIEDSAAPIRDSRQHIFGSVLVFRDVSERKQAEAALKERVCLLSLNAEVGKTLVGGHRLEAMLEQCTEALAKHFNSALARIWTLNAREEVLALRASSGIDKTLDEPYRQVPIGQNEIGIIAQERKPYLTNSALADARIRDPAWVQGEGMVAFAGFPLSVDNRLVGVMAVYSRKQLSAAEFDAMASVANDIAVGIERKTAQEQLQENQEWLRVTLASIGDAVIATDIQGRVSFLNGVAQDLTGWMQAEALGQPIAEVLATFDETTRRPTENPIEKVLREGISVDLGSHIVLVAKDGPERHIHDSAAPIRDNTGKMIGTVMVFRDVTGQRNAEHALKTSEARKSSMLETSLDCVITMDHDGKVVEFNAAAEQTFGYCRTQVVGNELADFIIPPALRKPHRDGLARFLATGHSPILGKRLELPALRADGTEFPAELAINRISTDGPPMFTAYVRDISERVSGEQHRNARLAATSALNQALDVKAGTQGVLRAVCESLAWDIGFIWLLNAQGDKLECLQSWHKQDLDIAEFEAETRNCKFVKGVGLPGRVWEARQATWILDIGHDENFPRIASAVKCGLHSAFGCPIFVEDRMLGVIEFFTQRIRDPAADLLEMIGTIAGSVGQFIERMTAEDELRKSERELSDFFENATVGLHWVGEDGTILRANRAELEMLGYTREEYIGRSIADFHADAEVISDILDRLQAGEQLREYPARLLCKDGAIKDVLIDSSVMFQESGFVHTRCFTRDVTLQKRSEQTAKFLADASAALAVLVDFDNTLKKVATLAVPYFSDWAVVDLVDHDGKLRTVAVAHIDPAKVELAHEFHRRFPPDPSAALGAWNILRTGRSERVQQIHDDLLSTIIQNDDQLRFIRELGLKSYIGVPLSVRGKTIGVLSFIAAESGHLYDETDLTVAQDLANRAAIAIENAMLYRELREADRRKDEFLATLAHELRNPLAPIRNGLEVMRLAGSNSDTGLSARYMMERQLNQMIRLVDDLLDMSRITRNKLNLKRQTVQLSAVIQSAVETSRPLIEEAGHDFSIQIPSTPIYLDADLTRLAQVFSNLINNSVKYTERGGSITLTAELAGDEVVVRVRDNGVGIPAEALPLIFQMFSQVDRHLELSRGGLGIGLTLVRQLVEMHGGTVEAHSDGLGCGSEFTVRLPTLKPDEIVSQEQFSSDHPATLTAKRRILIVDDNQDSAMSLSMILQLLDNETQTVNDGLTAIAVAEAFRPDMILLDIGLPKLNGYEVCRRIREQPWAKQTVIVALTGWGQEDDRRRSADAGFDHHFVKPVEFSVLESLLALLQPPIRV